MFSPKLWLLTTKKLLVSGLQVLAVSITLLVSGDVGSFGYARPPGVACIWQRCSLGGACMMHGGLPTRYSRPPPCRPSAPARCAPPGRAAGSSSQARLPRCRQVPGQTYQPFKQTFSTFSSHINPGPSAPPSRLLCNTVVRMC